MSAPVLLVVDGNSLVHRSFHAQASSGMRAADGQAIWAVRGLVGQILAAVERVGPDRVVIGFDDPCRSLRRERWPQYKAQRAEKPATLEQQLRLAAEVLGRMGLAVVTPEGLEADDVLASAAAWAGAQGGRTVVMTSDRDAFALINDTTAVLRIINGGVEASPTMTPERLVMLLGVHPEQYRDFAALRGDASDNLPGVRGVGAKTAARLLAVTGTARAAFDDVLGSGALVREAVGAAAPARLAEPAARAAWELNCAVMRMHTDLPLGLDTGAGGLPLDAASVREVFTELNLTWSIPKAMRSLCRREHDARPEPELQTVHRFVPTAGPRLRHAPLRRAPQTDQLSLF